MDNSLTLSANIVETETRTCSDNANSETENNSSHTGTKEETNNVIDTSIPNAESKTNLTNLHEKDGKIENESNSDSEISPNEISHNDSIQSVKSNKSTSLNNSSQQENLNDSNSKELSLTIKSELMEEDESQEEDEQGIENLNTSIEEEEENHENDNQFHSNYDNREEEGDEQISSKVCISVEDELKTCKGRLDAFGNELKILCAELEIVTGWIDQQFGIKLINKDSLLFKHIYDFEEIEQISAALSLLTEVQLKQQSGTRKRGRPPKKTNHEGIYNVSNDNNQVNNKAQTSGIRGRRKKSETVEILDDLNPQDFLETIYIEKDSESQNQSRPKRATRKKVNYKEDKELEMILTQKINKNLEEQLNLSSEKEDFLNEEIEESDQPAKKTKSRRRKITQQKQKHESGDKTDEDGQEDGESNDGESDEQTDENTEGEPNRRKKSERKRYPKKPGVVWNSSLPKQCDECGKVLKGTSTLKLHKMMHADERPHSCEICGNKFRFRRNLKVHIMAIHSLERPLQCSFCGRKFYAPKDLKIHERTHTGEKPYPCNLCPKRFNVKEHLTMHFRVHTGERPYKCPVCEKAFSQANSLRIHKKIHLREKEPTPRKPRKPRNSQLQQSTQGSSVCGSSNINPLQLQQPHPLQVQSPHSSNNSTPTPQQQHPHHHSQQSHHHLHQQSSVVASAASILNPHHSSSANSSGHSSPMPAHINNLTSLSSSIDKQPSQSSYNISSSNTSQSGFGSTAISSAAAVVAASAMGFHPQTLTGHPNNASSGMQPQNPFMVPLNENWRMPFGTTGAIDHQRFGSSTSSNNNPNRNSMGNRPENNFGLQLNQTSGSPQQQHVTDPRFHNFYSQNH